MDNTLSPNSNDEIVRSLVAERLKTLPDGAVISVGSDGEFTKEQLIESVNKGNDIGRKMIDIEMSFLQGLKDGILYDHSTSTDN
ncbi:MAG: hypothetical protein WCT19_01680 [Candidatus Paceibacterota bacterium]|jgi:hypothetical protein